MTQTKKKSSILEFAALFAVAYLLSQLAISYFFPKQDASVPAAPVVLAPLEQRVRQNNAITVSIQNNREKPLAFKEQCPQPPFDVFRVERPGEKNEALVPLRAADAVDCVALEPLAPGESRDVVLTPWKYSLFADVGTYEVRLPADVKAAAGKVRDGSGATVSDAADASAVRVTVYEPGWFAKLFRTFITKPFLNFLVLIASFTPGHNLGVAVIVLTLVVKIVLYFPTQKSLEGQKKMQLLQPKLDALKKKHKGDNAALQAETMKLWKEHKINPFSSCLPILLQFPILIGLFYVIRDGMNLALSQEYLYPIYQNLPWAFGTNFLGLDLTVPDWYIMPILLVALQYWQMRLTFERKKKEAAKKQLVDAKTGKPEPKERTPEDIQQQVMLYVLPLMIGFFAFQFPAAVSLYYGVSTLFGVGQQMVVNRRMS